MTLMQVRKSYEQRRARRRARGVQRPWQLRRMAMEEGDDDEGEPSAGGRGGGGSKAERKAAEAAQADRERFIEVGGRRVCCRALSRVLHLSDVGGSAAAPLDQ